MKTLFLRSPHFYAVSIVTMLLLLVISTAAQAAQTPVLTLTQRISEEPVLGGQLTYQIVVGNSGAVSIDDKGYNLTISNTLPAGLDYVSASIAPTFVAENDNGSTQLLWENIADIEVNEEIELAIVATLDAGLTAADSFENVVSAEVNTIPDNSGTWLRESSALTARPQAIDMELRAIQSTGDEQASGAGEYDGSADWPYQYQATVRNNNVASTESVVAIVRLDPGIAYMGNPTISPNPNGVTTTPSITLEADGSLELSWALGTLTTDQYATPVEINFDTAIPYRLRTSADLSAANGPFAGPMSGSIIPEDLLVAVDYEAIGNYDSAETSDGPDATPADDQVVTVTAEYLTVSKSASPATVGIGSTVTYSLNWYVSEYYAASNVSLTDVLPDGTTYVSGSASVEPLSVIADQPNPGNTTIVWELPASTTVVGSSGPITFRATVDPTYENAPLAGEPVVSGDSLTNRVTIAGDWADTQSARSGAANPDVSTATVNTFMPQFAKDVWDADSLQWTDNTGGFTGDAITYRLRFNSASNVDAKEIIVRDFLPRGMTFVPNSDTYASSGQFSSSNTCTSAPTAPTIGTLNGLQYLEWKLCSVDQNSSWEAQIDGVISDIPDAQPGWIVANFGKLSGQNSYGDAYSLRDLATTDYNAPELVLTKSAEPSSNLVADDTVTYTIDITNQGKATAYNIDLTDIVPADLLIAASGGSASPANSSYTTTAGNPSSGQGGTLQWSQVTSLAMGETLTYSYQATIPTGVVAGQSMTNLASVAYNSRLDNSGHQWTTSSNTADANTDDETVYVRGATVSKRANVSSAKIGDTVTWTITGRVPAGVIAYWPVVEENNLPNGFAFVAGSSSVSGATLDLANHANNPHDNGNKDVRWYLQTIDNTASDSDYLFTITFDTLVTGIDNGTPVYDQCCNENADNDAFIGWYDTAAGYNGQGFASHTFSINHYDRRSAEADADVKVIQPNLSVSKTSDYSVLGAGGIAVFMIRVVNNGFAPAYDVEVRDFLPEGLTLANGQSYTIFHKQGTVPPTTVITETNNVGDVDLSWQLNVLDVGATLQLVVPVRIPADISADLEFANVARVTTYSSQPGTAAAERIYDEITDDVALYTPTSGIRKASAVDGELTFGSDIVFTLTVPYNPIPAAMNNVFVTDTVDSRLEVVSVENGTANGNLVTANFASISVGQQETIVIHARMAADSSAQAGDIVTNEAYRSFTNAPAVASNLVAHSVAAPALEIVKTASSVMVEAGDTLTFTIEVSNVGNGEASGLVLRDVLPSTLEYLTGSATLDGAALADPTASEWQLPALNGGESAEVVFATRVISAETGIAYLNTASVSGVDSLGQAIPADNSAHVPADSNPTDSSTARFYGPLTCNTENLSVAYEDLKNVGWSDWDYNDVLIRITMEQCLTAADELAIVNIDYAIVARGAGYDHNFRHAMPLIGGGNYGLTIHDENGVLIDSDGGEFGELADFSIFGRTWEALAPLASLPEPFTNTRPEQSEYQAGHTASLSIVLADPAQNPASFMPPAPWDPYIHVYNTGEEVHLLIPGHLDNTQTVLDTFDATSPLLGQDLPLAHIFDINFDWPVEQFGLWRGYPDYTNYVQSGGTLNTDWDDAANSVSDYLWVSAPDVGLRALLNAGRQARSEAQLVSSYYAAPIAVESNGEQHIVIGNLLTNELEAYDGHKNLQWTAALDGGVKAAAAVGNLDADPALELVVGTTAGSLYAFDADGTPLAGFPVSLSDYRILATPAIADIDGDGSAEIVVPAADGRLYVRNADGSTKWDASIGDVRDDFGTQVINSSPVVANIDGVGMPEIVVGSYDKHLYVFNADGTMAWRFETADPILGTPVVADIDSASGGLEIAFGSSQAIAGYPRSFLFLLDANGEQLWQHFTGWDAMRASALAVDLDGNSDLELLIGTDGGKVVAVHHDGSAVAGWPQATGAAIASAPTVGDIDGDGSAEIIVASDDRHVHTWHSDGSAARAVPFTASGSIKGTPAVVSLDGDTAAEIVYADVLGELYIAGNAVTPTAVFVSTGAVETVPASAVLLLVGLLLSCSVVWIKRKPLA